MGSLLSIEPHIQKLRIKIDKALDSYLPKDQGVIQKAMRYSMLSGGKRIRPILAVEASQACNGSVTDAVPAACAIEFIHTYSLIHDDLPAMDNDDYRRGKLACHKVFGEANAILTGDALLTLAFNIIANNCKPKTALKITEELSDSIGADGMVGGQALDLEFRGKKKDSKILRHINILKTARLFEASARIGALSADASPAEEKALQKFGFYFGLSFQTIDDILDGEGGGYKEAGILINKAKSELKIFGKKADHLKEIAGYILKRTA